MKKLVSIILTLAMALSMAVSVLATECALITVEVDGEVLEFETPPFIEKDVTLVPMRAIFEQMGKKITWVGATESAWAEDENTLVYFWADGKKNIYQNAILSNQMVKDIWQMKGI